MNTALLIIDVQNDYFPNGRMKLFESIKTSLEIKNLLEYFRSKSMTVIHVQHFSTRPGATYLVPGTPGVEFHPNVQPLTGEKIVVKNYPNSFRKTGLDDYLKNNNISRLVIAGMMTHMCVDTTVRAAYDLGYECIVAGDACTTKTLNIFDSEISAGNVQNSFLAALNGVFSKIIKTAEVIELIK